MVKNLLKNGKIIYPNKLILKKKINIGIIGSGKIANEYSKVINSFGHKIKLIVSKTQNNNAKYIAKKYKAQIISNIKNIDKNLIIGSIFFGAGWGLAGLCPGPAISSISLFNVSSAIFVISMFIGFYIASKTN